ncbi:hypothetical protein TNCV_2427841 [Trichonephila clavipes]|nr:hypothetical protein TNCV_2427841 [Trichonephila clavipes]
MITKCEESYLKRNNHKERERKTRLGGASGSPEDRRNRNYRDAEVLDWPNDMRDNYRSIYSNRPQRNRVNQGFEKRNRDNRNNQGFESSQRIDRYDRGFESWWTVSVPK